MVRPMGGLGSHMVTLTQLHVLEIYYILTNNMADGPAVWRTPREGKSEVSLRGETLLPAPSLAWLMCLS